MNPKMCPTCGKQGVCYDTRKAQHHVKRNYECPRDGTRWQTQERFKMVKPPVEIPCNPPT